jgi:biotin transport system substrate-specific component
MTEHTKAITTTALMTAVLCILGPLSIPIGPVPISLGTLAIYLTMYVLDTKRGCAAVILYIMAGLAGLPVFSGFSGGAGKLFGPTGGYILGYIPMAFLIGLVIDRYYKNRLLCIIAIEAATWILYLLGTLWLAHQAGMRFGAALSAGVIPFILPDLAKIVAAALIGPVLRVHINRALPAAGE